MKVLQVNTTVNSGSVGRITEEIGVVLLKEGHRSLIAAAFTERKSQSEIIKIGSSIDRKFHGIKTRIYDMHGFGSKSATIRLIKQIEKIVPDIVHLHNIHGYYLHVGVLFDFLHDAGIPIIWTLHDCWSFTGHCSYFDMVKCDKWQTECSICPNKHGYPASWIYDNSQNNYRLKKGLFTSIDNMFFVTPSLWLARHVSNSFFNMYHIKVINNGVDIERFKPCNTDRLRTRYNLSNKNIILGVANYWDPRKGLNDFINIRNMLDLSNEIVLVGLSKKQIMRLPKGITGITHTENLNELAELYSVSSVFLNPTYVDNFPSTNIEALACGTPVVTYNTGGSPEAIDQFTGIVVKKGYIDGLFSAVNEILKNGKDIYANNCRERAVKFFNKDDRFGEYISLYYDILRTKN